MTGNKKRIVIQKRDRKLLEALAAMRIVDREQAQAVAGFDSTSRANVRLLALTHQGFLRRFFMGANTAGRKALYALSAKGAKLIGSPLRGPRRSQDELLVGDFFVEHQLTVNEIACTAEFGSLLPGVSFGRWATFFAPLANTQFIPDGYLELSTPSGTLGAFIEVDLGHESAKVWKQKIRNYLDYAVSGNHETAFGQKTFRVLVIANSERRLRSIRDTVRKKTSKLFSFAELQSIRRDGLLGPIWFRAQGDEPVQLIPPSQ